MRRLIIRLNATAYVVILVSLCVGTFAMKAQAADDLQALIAEMHVARDAMNRAQNSHQAADAWLRLQEATERFAHAFHFSNEACAVSGSTLTITACPEREILAQAKEVGVFLVYCASEESVIAFDQGYEEYLKLWPDGPRADIAWWRSHFDRACCDNCGPEIEDAEGFRNQIQGYKDFLKRFPKTSLRREVEALISQSQQNLTAVKSSNQ